MTHDPLCPGPRYADVAPPEEEAQVIALMCRCALIEAVRADERSSIVNVNWASTKTLVADARIDALRDAAKVTRDLTIVDDLPHIGEQWIRETLGAVRGRIEAMIYDETVAARPDEAYLLGLRARARALRGER